MKFTDQQLEAINCESKRILVLACAGSGKTSVIVGRIEKLKDSGVNPEQILALTFSNKAAKEMKARIRKLNFTYGSKINVKTFHSFGLELINSYLNTLGFSKKVDIVLRDESAKIIKDIFKKRNENAIEGTDILSYIHQTKSLEDYLKQPYLEEIAKEYGNELKSRNAVDMDDMIYLPIQLLKEFPNVKKAVCERYKYIFVDEYQDTNSAQNTLLDYITDDETNLFLVGDDDQAIYEWRGARPQYILDKAKDPSFQCLKLEKNFRSQGYIIDVANRLIGINKKRVEKEIKKDRPDSLKPIFKRTYSEAEESNWVAEQIVELIKSNRFNPSDIAIIFRNNKQLDSIKEAFKKHNINYETLDVDESSKYSRFIRVLKSICDLNSTVDLSEALNYPNRCFDKYSFEEAKNAYCDIYGQDLSFDTLTWINKIYLSEVSFDGDYSFRKRYSLITQLHEAKDWSATEIIAFIINYFKNEGYDKTEAEQFSYAVQAFDIAKNYEEVFGKTSLTKFVDHLIMSYENNDADTGTDVDAVNVLTMHRSKGLEFKVVFIIGAQVGIIPNDYFIETEYEVECERRLFYVAITRTKELLYISSFKDPLGGSLTNPFVHGFLQEIPTVYFGIVPNVALLREKLPPKEPVVNTKGTKEDATSIIKTLEDNVVSDNDLVEEEPKAEELDKDTEIIKSEILLGKNIEIPRDKFIVIIGACQIKLDVMQKILKVNSFPKGQYEIYDYDGRGFKITKYLNNSHCIGIILGPQAHKLEGVDGNSLKGKLIAEMGAPFTVDLIEKRITKHSLQEALIKIKWNYHLTSQNDV